ncbi:glycosyltransferase [Rhodopseudomonas sp. NSM]|uniref:glycosyltransferase n=1 Tax=Rhodopseudomonas sp. NSM TaxID=3457630 RepID=UPI004036CF33
MAANSKPVVLFSTADWDSPYWTNKQHIASRLADRGYRVLYVETVGIRRPGINALDARRIAARLRRGTAPIREVRPNLWVFSPLTIPLGHRFGPISRFNHWQLEHRVRSWLRAQNAAHPIVWTYHPYMLGAASAVRPSAIVYHAVDDLGAIPGVDRTEFESVERRLLERADHVFVTSLALDEHCRKIAGARTHYFNNVADIEHFGAARRGRPLPTDLAEIPGPRLMYVGALSNFKIDFGLLAALAKARPDWHLVFIGEEREGQRDETIAELRAMPNAHFLGWRPYAQLPDYLRGADVALLPQLINDYSRSMFPMKFFEYLAAGRPVIATALPALRDFAAIHRVAHGVAGFEVQVEHALQRPAEGVLPLDHPVLTANSWEARLDAMIAIIDGAPAKTDRTSGRGSS